MPISINGVNIFSSGRNIIVRNNQVIIDGVDVTPDAKHITVEIHGNVKTLQADVCASITVTGHAGSVQTQSGDVKINGDVSGSITTMSGDVNCATVGGNITTMSGDVRHR
jgi:hypothetical protein